MNAALAKSDMAAVTALAARYAEVDAKPSEAIKTEPRKTGRTNGEVWRNGTLADRRSILEGRTPMLYVTIVSGPEGVGARLDGEMA